MVIIYLITNKLSGRVGEYLATEKRINKGGKTSKNKQYRTAMQIYK